MKTKVSLITINYNSLQDTLHFLKKIEEGLNRTLLDLEVIVVDNHSVVSPKEALESYPWVKLILSESNLGFAGGNNLGVLASTGTYLFFVNNDTELDVIDLEELVWQYQRHPEYGVLNPVILNEDKSIQFAGYTELNKLTGRNKLITEINNLRNIADSSYPHGAAMLISKENFAKVGFMDENYFLYYEELDWGTRIKNSGLKIGVCLSSTIIHKESVSVGKISECKLYFLTRNRILYARKHYNKVQQLVFSLFFIVFSLPKNLILFLFQRDFKSIRAFTAAIFWHFTHDKTSTWLGYNFDYLLKGIR